MDSEAEASSSVSQLRETVANFCSKEIAPLAQKTDKEDQFPMEMWKKFGEMGLLGVTVPEELGGLGKGYLDHLIVMEEVRLRLLLFSHSCRGRARAEGRN